MIEFGIKEKYILQRIYVYFNFNICCFDNLGIEIGP